MCECMLIEDKSIVCIFYRGRRTKCIGDNCSRFDHYPSSLCGYMMERSYKNGFGDYEIKLECKKTGLLCNYPKSYPQCAYGETEVVDSI